MEYLKGRMRKPVFLDRDGVINVDRTPYVSALDQLELFPYTVESLVRLYEAGFDIFVVSNQQGVALGVTPPEVLEQINETIQEAIRPYGAFIKKFYYCTALDAEKHPWRKPSPGMILAARDEFGLDLTGAFMVGDKPSDMECAVRAGVRPLLVLSGVATARDASGMAYPPEAVFPTLKEAVDYIVASGSEPGAS